MSASARSVVAFPQHGGCLCGDLRYSLAEDPLTLYVCHCTDCQRQTGSSFALSMLVRLEALEYEVRAHGTVAPRTEGDLVPQVSGPVVSPGVTA